MAKSSPCLYVLNLNVERIVVGFEKQDHSPTPNITELDVLVSKQVYNEVIQYLARGETVRQVDGDLVVVGLTLEGTKRNFNRTVHERFALESRKPYDYNGVPIMVGTDFLTELTAAVVAGSGFYRWLGDDKEVVVDGEAAPLLLSSIMHHKNSLEMRRMSFLTECKSAINILAVRELAKRLEKEEW